MEGAPSAPEQCALCGVDCEPGAPTSPDMDARLCSQCVAEIDETRMTPAQARAWMNDDPY